MLKQSLQQKLLQKLSPQQIQLMKLLQLPTVALEQRIKEELETNPALEEGEDQFEASDTDAEVDDFNENGEETDFDISEYFDDDDIPAYKLNDGNRSSSSDEQKSLPYSIKGSFHELLEDQVKLRIADEKKIRIAQHLIGSLDDSGYLRRELEALVDDLAFSQNLMTDEEEVQEVLAIIQDLDPPGIGARDLRECLLIQLRRFPHPDLIIKNAIYIIENLFEEFTKKHYKKIIDRTDITEEDLKEVVGEILRLNPKPGGSMQESQKTVQEIIPDFTINIVDGELELSVNGRNSPALRVSRSYAEMLDTYDKSKKKDKEQKQAVMFVKHKLDSAKWFIDAIRQRQETLVRTMSAIMERQQDYFLEGDETLLRPMILKDIAEMIEMDISTVSRVVNSKYVQTPYGTFLLKTFFSESITTDSGEEVSTREVKKILSEIIENEDKKKPVTDDHLSELLKEKGYSIARRTVAKYREQLNIPVARLRKEL